jgi:YfiH family protein
LKHAFSTRCTASGERFDLGSHDDRAPSVAERRRRFLSASGLGGRRPTGLHQVHGATVVDVTACEAAAEPAADGAVAFADSCGAWAPAVRWADCVPVLLAARDGSAVAAVHAGWRGIVAGVATRAVMRLRDGSVGTEGLVAALGPAIGVCCYDVGSDVASAVARAADLSLKAVARRARGRLTLNLRLAVRMQLERAGLDRGSIHLAPWCTSCESAWFFSHRREGARAGRQMACIGWPAAGPA